MTPNDFLKRYPVEMKHCRLIADPRDEPDPKWEADHFQVVLKTERGSASFWFSMGIGNRHGYKHHPRVLADLEGKCPNCSRVYKDSNGCPRCVAPSLVEFLANAACDCRYASEPFGGMDDSNDLSAFRSWEASQASCRKMRRILGDLGYACFLQLEEEE